VVEGARRHAECEPSCHQPDTEQKHGLDGDQGLQQRDGGEEDEEAGDAGEFEHGTEIGRPPPRLDPSAGASR
jgi:hypothetical protein